ncbi:MAG TPA: penicillin-binding protein 2 [Clostridiaceae bacterium]|nr:penicillin-binding protein 2 [Clostridiaceae bacterium]
MGTRTLNRIIYALVAVCILFFSLVAYLTYFELFQKNKIINNSYNRRQFEMEEKTLRGSILDRNGTVLAESEFSGEKQVRKYPYGSIYSHVIGYSSRKYGKSLIEAKYNDYLLGVNESSTVFNLRDKLSGGTKEGNNIYLSIDHELQTLANELMKNKKGAVVALDPKTGEILAMISKPDFDPNEQKLEENWKSMVESEEAPFLTRATQGLYTPGSTFKVLTVASALENGMENNTYKDSGSVVIDGKEISNFGGKAYGEINLKTALAVSSNTVFASIGVELGEENLRSISERAGIGEKLPFDIPVSKSVFQYKNMSKTDMAAVGMGQGKILMTPLHMAMVSAAIANDGIMIKPSLVSRIETHKGTVLKKHKPDELYRVMDEYIAAKINEMMQEVVNNGTGKNASIKGIKVAGKTGTAENELTSRQKNKEHAWFIGFAPADDPRIAVAVILEYSGSTGGSAAAPIARELISAWLKG